MIPRILSLIGSVLAVAVTASGSTLPRLNPYKQFPKTRQLASDNSLCVDLGYEVYEGVANTSARLNVWKG